MRQTSHLWSVSCHTLRSISGVTSATVAVIRVWSWTFAGKVGTNTRSLTNSHKKKFQECEIRWTRWPCSTNLPNWEMGAEVLIHCSKVMMGCAVLLEVNASILVIFSNCGMRNCWSMSRYTILGNGRLYEEEGADTRSLLRAQNAFTFGLSRTRSKKTSGFPLPHFLQLCHE
jgi:hypothetical protein